MTLTARSDAPVLFAFSGLPGVGKSVLAQEMAKRFRISYIRVDTVEQALRDLCGMKVQGEGYRLSYRILSENLRLGNSVIFDSCNPVELTRNELDAVAKQSGARCVNIVVVCSDLSEHQRRVEMRGFTVPGLQLPTWQNVMQREYAPWTGKRITIDTMGKTVEKSVEELLWKLKDGLEPKK